MAALCLDCPVMGATARRALATPRSTWERQVVATVRAIPSGRVASYGLVALVSGRAGAARAVGNVMRGCRDRTVPCHRVVHADGSLAFAGQRERLLRERVPFRGARVDVRACLWAARLPDAGPRRRARREARSSSGSMSASTRMTRKASAAA